MSVSSGSPQALERLPGPATEGSQPGARVQTRVTTWGEAATKGPGFTGPARRNPAALHRRWDSINTASVLHAHVSATSITYSKYCLNTKIIPKAALKEFLM